MSVAPAPVLVCAVGTPEGIAAELLSWSLARAGVAVVPWPPGRDGRRPAAVVLLDPVAATVARARGEGVPVVVLLGGAHEPGAVAELVIAGADAVLDPGAGVDEVVDALRRVDAGETVLDPFATRALAEAARAGLGAPVRVALTRREAEILESIRRGDSVKQTARALGVAAKTVENLQSRLYRKLGVRNRAQAVAAVLALGLLPVDDE